MNEADGVRPPLTTQLLVRGFRTLRDVELTFRGATVVVGANGAGKSNLLGVVRLLALIRTASLRRFVAEQGGASALLHYGPKTTPEIQIKVTFESDAECFGYEAHLAHAAGDRLIFSYEAVFDASEARSMGLGHDEAFLATASAQNTDHALTLRVREAVDAFGYFHFHDTSKEAPLRNSSRVVDSRYLRSLGQNLAAYLLRMRDSRSEDDRAAWRRIMGTLRLVAPFVKSLDPRVTGDSVYLEWIDERDHLFNVHDMSDGTLRFLALVAALEQPPKRVPKFLVIDEPELGLHPAAIAVLVELVRGAAVRGSVILATQSPYLLDFFQPEEVLVAERRDGSTEFARLDPAALAEWLTDYRLSELFDKYVIGGQP